MAFRRKGKAGRSGNARGATWYTWPTLPGIGRPPAPWATGTRARAMAERIEVWLQEIALERPQLIDGLLQKRYSLPDLWVAKQTDTLDDILRATRDPLLRAAAATYGETLCKDARVKHGLLELSDLADAVEARRAKENGLTAPAPGTLRLSWLLAPANITELYAVAASQGRASNSVYRSVHRAVAELLAHHVGKAKRNAIMVDVAKPGDDDTREVRISAAEIARVLQECDDEFRDIPALAILLAVDLGPLLRIAPRYIDEERGTLGVLDTKTASRPRTIALSTPALAILRRRSAGRGLDEPLFDLTPGQVRHRWDAVRDRAAGCISRNRRERGAADPVQAAAVELLHRSRIVTLPLLRFKDLRHLLPTAWNALGLPHSDLQGVLGHARGSRQTERYITARTVGERENMNRIAEHWGLDRYHLKAAGA